LLPPKLPPKILVCFIAKNVFQQRKSRLQVSR